MSNKEQDRVWEHSKQRGAGLIVMLAIANRADDNGICWPGQKDLATRARVSRRSIQRFIDRAAADGEVAVIERPGKSHLYVVLVGLTDDEKTRRLGLVTIKKIEGDDTVSPVTDSHPLPAPTGHPTCANLSIPGAQTPAQIGQPGAQVYAQSGRRTIIEPSVESTAAVSNQWIFQLYLDIFKETVTSGEHDDLTELAQVFSVLDITDAFKITKKRNAGKRIGKKVLYTRGILQAWGRDGKPNTEDDEGDDDAVPHIGFGRTLIDLRPERLRSNA